jgi:hypothetical protein
MSALQALRQRIVAELAGNARLRAAAWAVAGLLLLYWLLLRMTAVDVAHADYVDARQRLDGAQAMLERENWAELRTEAEAADSAIAARFWQAETQAQAQAQLRAAVTRMIGRLGLRDGRIQSGVSQAMPEVPDVWEVQAQFSFVYVQGAELRILDAIATHPKKLVVRQLDIAPGRLSRMVLIVAAHFVGIDDGTDAPGVGP